MTPAEVYAYTSAFFEREARLERSALERTEWLVCELYNSSGNMKKGRQLKPGSLLKRKGATGKSVKARDVSMAQRKLEAEETLRLHKAKCWTKLRGRSVDDVGLDSRLDEQLKRFEQERLKRMAAGRSPIPRGAIGTWGEPGTRVR